MQFKMKFDVLEQNDQGEVSDNLYETEEIFSRWLIDLIMHNVSFNG